MDVTVESVCRHFDFLLSATGYSLTLHGDLADIPQFLPYNYHLHPYCQYIKSACGLQKICQQKQAQVLRACAHGAFSGVCHAGVLEYVYPVFADGKAVAFLSVSGFFPPDSPAMREKLTHFATRYGLSERTLSAYRRTTLSAPPPKETVDAAVAGLLCLLSAFLSNRPPRPVSDLYTQTLQYLHSHYTTHCTLETLREALHASVSSLCHQFQAHSGMSIRAYIAQLRLRDAKWLLSHSALSVTQIASAVGFCTPAYFTKVFHRAFGMTPHAFRKESTPLRQSKQL